MQLVISAYKAFLIKIVISYMVDHLGYSDSIFQYSECKHQKIRLVFVFGWLEANNWKEKTRKLFNELS